MATRGMDIGRQPVNLTSVLSLVNGRRYIAQNTANGGGAVLYIAEIEDSEPNPTRGDDALELHINKMFKLEPQSGLNIWCWCGVDNGRLVVSEAS